MSPKSQALGVFVGDYRRLNSVTKKDSYSLPYIGDFPGKLHGHAVFSTVDLKDAYHQIPVHPDDIEKNCHMHPLRQLSV